MPRADLFVDIDDTLIAECYTDSGFDLRPGVMTQLYCLSKMFKCYWLTHWGKDQIKDLVKSLYGDRVISNFTYCGWQHFGNKATAVLEISKDFWWLEDPLSRGDMRKVKEANLMERCIAVEPKGQWGFLLGIQEMFSRAGITAQDIKQVGGRPEWFQKF